MSTTTTTLDACDSVGAETAGSGLLGRMFRRIIAAREASARAMVDGHLSRLSEASLVDLGFEAAEIRRIRAHGSQTPYYWI